MRKSSMLVVTMVMACFAIMAVDSDNIFADNIGGVPEKLDTIQQTIDNQVIPLIERRREVVPVWQITQDGTAESVEWGDHEPNPRFAIYDPGTSEDETDDVVLDKETGLVWERTPDTTTRIWTSACAHCYIRGVANRKGWRLPTIEELASLVDPNNNPSLPNDHPFVNVQSSTYCWSSTTRAGATDNAWVVNFDDGNLTHGYKTLYFYVWCVRGGPGHNAY